MQASPLNMQFEPLFNSSNNSAALPERQSLLELMKHFGLESDSSQIDFSRILLGMESYRGAMEDAKIEFASDGHNKEYLLLHEYASSLLDDLLCAYKYDQRRGMMIQLLLETYEYFEEEIDEKDLQSFATCSEDEAKEVLITRNLAIAQEMLSYMLTINEDNSSEEDDQGIHIADANALAIAVAGYVADRHLRQVPEAIGVTAAASEEFTRNAEIGLLDVAALALALFAILGTVYVLFLAASGIATGVAVGIATREGASLGAAVILGIKEELVRLSALLISEVRIPIGFAIGATLFEALAIAIRWLKGKKCQEIEDTELETNDAYMLNGVDVLDSCCENTEEWWEEEGAFA